MSRESQESGELVYPRVPVPKGQRESKPKLSSDNSSKKLILVAAATLGFGLIAGFIVRPMVSPDKRIGELGEQLAEATKGEGVAKDRADGLVKDVAAAKAAQAAAEQQLKDAEGKVSTLASKAADAQLKIKESEAVEAKLKAAVDKSSGSVTTEGDEIHLQLVDKVLFNVNDDQLTPTGKKVIDRVATALKDLPDKQVFVQGHTDDQPIFIPPPPKKPKPGTPPVVPRFATNWELSAARALNVVHYLQDVAKIDPSRLAALAFGQYRPISKSNKAVNRRIEIVLYPKRTILKK